MQTAPGTTEPTGERVALVLEAGGARSAYQVGALQVLLPALSAQGQRPHVLVGTSAGALLTGALAASAHLDAADQAAGLLAVLDGVTKRHVMRPLWRQVPEVALRYASETLGLSAFRLRGLFGTDPLAATLDREIDWAALHRNVDHGVVGTTAVTATAVRTGQVVLFAESAGPLPGPSGARHRRFVPTRLGVEHLMASSAIPALFPSVQVHHPQDAAGWYVDGATRRRVPLAPALELGADRIVVVGAGSLHPPVPDPARDRASVDLGDGGATLLGAVMDDPLRADLRRLAEINEQAGDVELTPHLDRHRSERSLPHYRQVPYVAVAPERGEEISDLAMAVFRANHGTVRRTLGDPDLQVMHRLMGSDSPLQGELLSYLMFDPDFFSAAVDLGRRDAERWVEAHPGLWRTAPVDPPRE